MPAGFLVSLVLVWMALAFAFLALWVGLALWDERTNRRLLRERLRDVGEP